MEFIHSMNQRVKKIGIFDLILVKISNWFFALIVLKLIPGILNVNTGWLVVLIVLFSLKPFYAAWIKKDGPETAGHLTKKLSFMDIQLIKIANWLFAIILVKFFPEILNVNIGWFIVLLVLFSIIPFYTAWIKDEKQAFGSA